MNKKILKLTRSRLSHQAIIDTEPKSSSTSFGLFFYPGQAQKSPACVPSAQNSRNQPNTKAHSTRRQPSFHKNRAATLRSEEEGRRRTVSRETWRATTCSGRCSCSHWSSSSYLPRPSPARGARRATSWSARSPRSRPIPPYESWVEL